MFLTLSDLTRRILACFYFFLLFFTCWRNPVSGTSSVSFVISYKIHLFGVFPVKYLCAFCSNFFVKFWNDINCVVISVAEGKDWVKFRNYSLTFFVTFWTSPVFLCFEPQHFTVGSRKRADQKKKRAFRSILVFFFF